MKMKGCQRERRRTGPARVKDKKRGTKDAGTKEKNCEEKKRTTKAVKVRFKDQRPYLLMADETVVPESRKKKAVKGPFAVSDFGRLERAGLCIAPQENRMTPSPLGKKASSFVTYLSPAARLFTWLGNPVTSLGNLASSQT